MQRRRGKRVDGRDVPALDKTGEAINLNLIKLFPHTDYLEFRSRLQLFENTRPKLRMFPKPQKRSLFMGPHIAGKALDRLYLIVQSGRFFLCRHGKSAQTDHEQNHQADQYTFHPVHLSHFAYP